MTAKGSQLPNLAHLCCQKLVAHRTFDFAKLMMIRSASWMLEVKQKEFQLRYLKKMTSESKKTSASKLELL